MSKTRLKKCPSCKGTGEMKIVQGRPKGQKFERDIAKLLTVWTGVEFRRTPMSGGWNKTGDITPKNPEMMEKFPFSIECKNHENWSLGKLLGATRYEELPAPIRKFWGQAVSDAEESGKIPILIFKQLNCPPLLMYLCSLGEITTVWSRVLAVREGTGLCVVEKLTAETYYNLESSKSVRDWRA